MIRNENVAPPDNTLTVIIDGELENFIKSQTVFNTGLGEVYVGAWRFERKPADPPHIYRFCTKEVFEQVRFALRSQISDFESMDRFTIKVEDRVIRGHNEYDCIPRYVDISITKNCTKNWDEFFKDCSNKYNAVKEMQVKLQEHNIPFIINSIT
jgi:hypothetical protein